MTYEIPFHPQEKDYSCVPACLRMVVASSGLDLSEEDLIRLCNCTAQGTSPGNLVSAAIQLGFDKTSQDRLELDDLRGALANGIFPIVWLRTIEDPLAPFPPTHAVVAIRIGKQVSVRDPAKPEPESRVPRQRFLESWTRAGRLTVLVSK
jgi:ABC-type bacteriocin/lantibiotic exporter with double-glycine peptidase domain